MDTTEIVFALAIASVYPFFFSKLTNKLVGYDNVNNMCGEAYRSFYVSTDKKKGNNCFNERDEKLKSVELHKHLVLIAFALIALVISSFIQTKSTKLGVGFGGVLTLIVALFGYWHRYGETSRLVALGVSLLFLIFFSVRLYKIESMADIFSIELNTK